MCASECTCLWSREKALDLLVCCEPPNTGAGRIELSSLQEQRVLLTTEPSLQLLSYFSLEERELLIGKCMQCT